MGRNERVKTQRCFGDIKDISNKKPDDIVGLKPMLCSLLFA